MNWRIYLLLYSHYQLISPKERKTQWWIVLSWYDFSFYSIAITSEELREKLFFGNNSELGSIPTIPQYSHSRCLYSPKAYICIVRFWKALNGILARKSECNDMFPSNRKCIHNRCCHRDWFWWFLSIHHGHGHLDSGLRGISSEDISSQLAESIIQSGTHISIDLYLSNDISTIVSYLISISFLDEDICRLLYSPYYNESTNDPDDDSDDEDDEKRIHHFIICVYEIIAKTNPRKIPKWMGRIQYFKKLLLN